MPWVEGQKGGNKYDPNKLHRFYLPPGAKAEVTILSYEPFLAKEYAFKEEGRKISSYEYTDDRSIIPAGKTNPIKAAFSDQNVFEQEVALLLIINHTEYTDKKGEKRKDYLQLLGLHKGSKKDDQEKFKEELAERGTLRGLRCKVARSATDFTASKIGDNWQFREITSELDLLDKYTEQVKRAEILLANNGSKLREMVKPKSYKELCDFYGTGEVIAEEKEEKKEPEQDDDIPF